MATESRVGPRLEPNRFAQRLDSWKQIAAYVDRHVTTVRRWEKCEGLPVHRHVHNDLGSVYAFSTELDAWLQSRQPEGFSATARDSVSDFRAAPAFLSPPPSLSLPSSAVGLLGREQETELLRRAWAAASCGKQQLILISGDPGQGKTRFAVEFAASVAPRAAVLAGSCEREAVVPFAPFLTMLAWLLRAGTEKVLRQCLKDVEGSSELAQLVPEISKLLPRTPQMLAATAEARRFRMFEAFAQLVTLLSSRCPMLLLFEDLHWADRGSLVFLRHLIRSTRQAALCIVVTYSENEPARTDLSEEIFNFRRESPATQIHLVGLADDHVRRFVQTWTHDTAPPWLTELIIKTTEGNPLFIGEMLAHFDRFITAAGIGTPADLPPVGTGLPECIRQLVRSRLAHLSPECRSILALGAVIGREFELRLIETVANLPEDEVLDRIEEAVGARVLCEMPAAPGRFSFTHALVRETILSDILAARRVRLHHRIGEAAERLGPLAKVSLGQLAYHFTEAASFHAQEKAVDHCLRAGDDAFTRLALEAAARFYGMALQVLDLLPPGPLADDKRLEAHVKRGRSLSQVGQWALARTEFELAINLLDADEKVKRCELLVDAAEAAFWLMDVCGLRNSAKQAELIANQIGRDDLWTSARAWTASAQIAEGNVLGGLEIDRQTLRRAGGIRSFALARVPLTLYWAGQSREAVEHGAQAVEQARKSGDPAFLLYAIQHFGIALSGAGRYEDALSAFDEARTFGRDCGALPLLARAISMSTAPLLSLGDFDGAAQRAIEARELAHRVAFQPPLVSAGIDLRMIYARTHELGRVEPLLSETKAAIKQAQGWHAWKWRMRLSQARAELASARGEWTDTIIHASDVIEQSEARSRPKYQALGLATRALARGQLGMRQAADDAHAAVAVAQRLSDPAVLLQCLGVLLKLDGNSDILRQWERTVRLVLAGLTHERLRQTFLASLPLAYASS